MFFLRCVKYALLPFLGGMLLVQHAAGLEAEPPLEMKALRQALSLARGVANTQAGWPRTIAYIHEVYDFRRHEFERTNRTFTIERRPQRIVPHGVGVSEILWAICPRERIVACNELTINPDFCFIAAEIKRQCRLFSSKQSERIIGYRPDLVFTVSFSDAAFKAKLEQARIAYFDLGYHGTIESIKRQIMLIGQVIGEEGNAAELGRVIDEQINALKARLPATSPPPRVMFYDQGGYIPGAASNFNSICAIIGADNVGARQGIKTWSRIDFETLLKWDPQIIVVPQGSHLKEQLLNNPLLAHALAVKQRRIHEMPSVYLNAGSQYLLLSANMLAGIVYDSR